MKDYLAQLRMEIDAIDEKVVHLLNERAALAQRVGAAKKGATKFNPVRERQVINRVRKIGAAGPLSPKTIEAIFRETISGCLSLEEPMQITYLGPAGTYSEEVATKRFGSMAKLIPCEDIDGVVRTAEAGVATLAVVPVENSVEGAVNRTLDILRTTTLRICDEAILPIHHCVLGGQKVDFNSATKVVAHSQSLAQCHHWLSVHLPRAERISVSSNGEAARLANSMDSCVAIASKQAATTYNLSVLAENIEDDSSNSTRFLVLGRIENLPSGDDKTSLICAAPNRPGALAELLNVLSKNEVNMVKLESRPSDRGQWEYEFYIDIEGHIHDVPVATAIDQLRQKAVFIKILGSYPRAR